MPLSEGYSEPFPDLGDPRIKACLRLPGAFRSLATSFVGSRCQGILTCTHGSLTKFSLEIVLLDVSRSHPIVKDHPDRSPRLLTPTDGFRPRQCSYFAKAGLSANTAHATTLAVTTRLHRFTSNQPYTHRHHPLGTNAPSTLVETIGVEPTTFWLQTRRSTS